LGDGPEAGQDVEGAAVVAVEGAEEEGGFAVCGCVWLVRGACDLDRVRCKGRFLDLEAESRIPDQEIDRRECRRECGRHTIVLHHVQTSLREDGNAHGDHIHLACLDTILANHVSRRVTRDSSNQVGSPRVQMRWQHTAGSQLEKSHAGAEASESREASSIGVDDSAGGRVVVFAGVEVEVPVFIGRQKGVAVEVCGGHAEGGV